MTFYLEGNINSYETEKENMSVLIVLEKTYKNIIKEIANGSFIKDS